MGEDRIEARETEHRAARPALPTLSALLAAPVGRAVCRAPKLVLPAQPPGKRAPVAGTAAVTDTTTTATFSAATSPVAAARSARAAGTAPPAANCADSVVGLSLSAPASAHVDHAPVRQWRFKNRRATLRSAVQPAYPDNPQSSGQKRMCKQAEKPEKSSERLPGFSAHKPLPTQPTPFRRD